MSLLDIQSIISKLKSKDYGDVLIVGGGISGIQAALDLANSKFKVYLLDSAPTIGGHMAMLDKTFPTNDCSMCIESPKFVECYRHPNIELLTYSEVEKVSGSAGNFNVNIKKKPRYVEESKCTGCTACVEYCPVKYPDQFNQNISKNKAIHIYFAQAVPLVTYIDDSCLYLQGKKCGICESVCKTDAINFNQKPEYRTLNVGAIILSLGFSPFDATLLKEYGYGVYKNVVTSLDYERLMCATGPFNGEILRLSDFKHPKKIAWIQCVGSRSVIKNSNSYCSSVCCTYTQKQVILTKDHEPDAECVVFHNDIRSFGKDFERFFQRASNLSKVRFIRSYVSIVGENRENNNIKIRYSTFDKGVVEEEFDMVVLSVGLTPPKDYKKIKEIFNIDLTEKGFCRINPESPSNTSIDGIFVSGAFMGPMDIPEAVYSASSSVAKTGELLNKQRGKLSRQRLYPIERDVSKEEPRIGVYLCHCGANIGSVVNIRSIMEEIKNLPYVVHCDENLFICSTEAAATLVKDIKEKNLNRVVVAACTPRTHEPLFRDTLREAGINQYLFEFANIREHCSWVHSKEKEEATKKAFDLVKMAVARASKLEPLEEFTLPVDKRVLVVGGGISGMVSSLSLAKQGFHVYLIEKTASLGGNAKYIQYTLEGMDIKKYLSSLIESVNKNPLIHIYLNAKVAESTGYVGNFSTKVKIKDERIVEIKHGATVIAVGAREYTPTEYSYGKHKNIMTNRELELRIGEEDKNIINANAVAFIQCVGSRNEVRNYCSRICCSNTIKNAIKLKEKNKEMDIYVFFRDIRTYGFREDYYKKASELGVRFIRFEPESPPIVDFDGENIRIKSYDYVLNKTLEIQVDYLSLASAIIPNDDSTQVAKFFKVNLGPDGFFQEAHVKLRPVDFGAEGVYLAGLAHYPKHITESILQANAASGRAVTLLSHDTVLASGSVCTVDEKKCIGCGACVDACAYGAIELKKSGVIYKAVVNPILCKGDGLCNSKCPTLAISLKHYTEEQLLNQIYNAVSNGDEENKNYGVA